jgi:putative membrane protein
MFKRVGIVVAAIFMGLFLAVGLPSLAQSNPNTPAPSSNRSQLTLVDQQFMIDANRNALAGIALGQLALNQSQNNEVKRFAQAEVDEQVGVRNNLVRLAPSLGVNLPSEPTPRDQEVMRRMAALSGEQFDLAFMNEAGINAHLENAAIYQREAAMGQNQDLVGLASQGLAIITQHYNTASALTGYEVAQIPPRIDSVPRSGMSIPRSNQNGNPSPTTPNSVTR